MCFIKLKRSPTDKGIFLINPCGNGKNDKHFKTFGFRKEQERRWSALQKNWKASFVPLLYTSHYWKLLQAYGYYKTLAGVHDLKHFAFKPVTKFWYGA